MVDVALPIGLKIARIEWRYLESGGRTASPYTGAIRTRNLGGDRLACTIDFTIAKDSDRAQLISFIGALRGQTNRAIVVDPSHTPRGTWSSVAGGERATNADFANGTTGWAASAAMARSAADGVYRSTLVRDINTSSDWVVSTNFETVNQYYPHVLRMAIKQGLFTGSVLVRFRDAAGSAMSDSSTSISSPDGYYVTWAVPPDATCKFALNSGPQTGPVAGNHINIPFLSASQCMLADGRSNALLHSSSASNAAWSKIRASGSAVAGVAPDGASDAEALIEDGTASSSHYMVQSVARSTGAFDICGYGLFKRRLGTRNVGILAGNDGTDRGRAVFDLSNGTIVSGPTNDGAATNCRAFVVDYGDGWYYCCVIARLPSAATQAMYVQLVNGTSTSYSGDSTSSIYCWKVGSAISSVPTYGAETTSAAVAGSAPKGSVFYVKGAPVSQSGLLKPGDWVEIIAGSRSFKRMLTAPLNTDAAGLGYLQVSPPVPFDVADNAPIIVTKPASRMVCVSDPPSWPTEPGLFTRVSLDFVESGD